DLPGTYSLTALSPDEEIALAVLLGEGGDTPRPDVVVVVADALHLERNLFLASQVIGLGLPTVMALNQFDAAEAAGFGIDVPALIAALGVAVIPTVATRGEGIDPLRRAIERAPTFPPAQLRLPLDDALVAALRPLAASLRRAGLDAPAAEMQSLRLLAVPQPERPLRTVLGLPEAIETARNAVQAAGRDPWRLEAEVRYAWIDEVVRGIVTRTGRQGRTGTDRLDAVLLHRLWGPLIFVALLAVVFQAVFAWATPLMDGIEALMATLGNAVGRALPEGPLRGLLVEGVIAGAGSVLVFLPQIAILFLLLGILEDSGYMARAALLMDRPMRAVGLPGRSVIPLISGYACAVPGIMSTRTIADPRDRLVTILVLPLMSCSARLPVYTLLIGAFVPSVLVGGFLDLRGLTLFVMYALGTLAVLGVAWLFRRTLVRGPVRPLIMELPPYRMPSVRGLIVSVWHRVRLFLRRAGTVILSLSIVLWALATWPRTSVPEGTPPARAAEMQLEGSALGRVGKAIEPAVRPLGFDWKIGVSIAASFAAREVFVTTMGTIYGVQEGDAESGSLRRALQEARDPATGVASYTTLTAVGLMVFYVFALMCMSTLAITTRETGGGRLGVKWASVQFGYTLVLAWVAAYAVRQVGLAMGWGA
ncbi:MAG TPA: ferrous iron transport protein B, partial [Gemmatimonadales bacterium]|nr:ferrous iron transport protein B [Gemmatimonadales bacterium]